jgi:hypothetical protein
MIETIAGWAKGKGLFLKALGTYNFCQKRDESHVKSGNGSKFHSIYLVICIFDILGTCAEVTSVEYCYQRNWHKRAVTSVIIGLG